MSTRKVNCCRC